MAQRYHFRLASELNQLSTRHMIISTIFTFTTFVQPKSKMIYFVFIMNPVCSIVELDWSILFISIETVIRIWEKTNFVFIWPRRAANVFFYRFSDNNNINKIVIFCFILLLIFPFPLRVYKIRIENTIL